MKNVYVIETIETCKVWKQYDVEAYTIEDAKRIVLGDDYFQEARQIDHYIDTDLGVDKFLSVKHITTVEEA